jgi:hypothetical protein
MNLPSIYIIKLVVDNTQPQYPQRVVSIIANLSGTNNGGEQGMSYLFDVSAQTLSDNFVPYAQLTEEQLVEWIRSPALADQLAAAHAEFDSAFGATVPPIAYLDPPWVPQPVTPLPPADINDGGSSPSATATTGTSTSTATTGVSVLPLNALASEERIRALIYQVLEEIQASEV